MVGLACWLVVAAGSSCESYGVGYVLDTSPGSKDTEIVATALDDVAHRFQLHNRTDYRAETPVALPDESKMLLEFASTPARGKAEDGARSQVLLGLVSSRDGSQLRVVLQDMERGSNSPYFLRIQKAVEESLTTALPGRQLSRQSGRLAPQISSR
jgi:hypothetical protein